MIYLRHDNPALVRPGKWGHLFSIQHTPEGKDVWVVEFPDGEKDAWPSWDHTAGYEVLVQVESPTFSDV